MTALLEAEAQRERFIRVTCKPCADSKSGKRCDCCMVWFAIRELDAEIDAAADAEAERRGI